VKYRTSSAFDRDFAGLPPEHRRMFLTSLREHFLPASTREPCGGTPPGRAACVFTASPQPDLLMTWNFSSPDGRATFHLKRSEQGHDAEPILVWRRIGDHGIYRNS